MNCPLCGSSDLDEFEDETGWFCFGCSNNVFKTEVQAQARRRARAAAEINQLFREREVATKLRNGARS